MPTYSRFRGANDGPNPHLLVVLGQASWLEWLPEFLDHPTYTTELVTLPPDSDGAFVRGARHDGVVFLSHHSTLGRDAQLAESLRREASVPVLCHPLPVAVLAGDKRAMAGFAAAVPGLRAIPELTPRLAVDYLGVRAGNAVVRKQRRGTEGQGLRVLREVGDLERAEEDWLLQPFVDGCEFSVNLIRRGERVLAFEPVFKGSTSLDGVHPCRRERLCPWPDLGPAERRRMIALAVRYAAAIGADGLVEVEFVLRGEDVIFLEVNPRLSATMRLASLACERSIFVELLLSLADPDWAGGEAAAMRFGGERPIPKNVPAAELARLRNRLPLWVSTRASTVAPDPRTLRSQLDELAAGLAAAETLTPEPIR